MKKLFLFILSTLFIIVFLVTCKKDDLKVASVKLNKESLTLGVGETETLIATVLPENANNKTVTWTSSNTFVATVMPNGLVTALSKGVATIVVTTVEGNFSATCAVNVDEIPVTSVMINKTQLILDIDETETLVAIVLPENATIKELYWTSSNPLVATVTSGLVTPRSVGAAKIVVTTLDGNKTATCDLRVTRVVVPDFEMVFVKGGTSTMGCTDDECMDIELPAHQVTVSSFYMGKYEVTQKEWVAVMGSNPSMIKGDNLPVENVSWDDVQVFLTILNAASGKKYRLPTEAEWEYAARGGNTSFGFKYSGSNNLDEVAWYVENSGHKTHPVGTKQPNELGIHDMSGNVYEWCNDWVGAYSASAQTNPQGPSNGSSRIDRGGCYDSNINCRVSFREGWKPNFSSFYLGFRLVLSL